MKKILLSLVLLLACVGGWAQNVARLTFARTGTDASSVAVSVVDENGEAIDGTSATLVSTSHNFKGTAGNVTESILCPNVNANTSPTIELKFKVMGLSEFYTFNELGLHIHALNGTNGYQEPNDNKDRKWNVDVDAQESDFGILSDIDIAAGITGSNKMWEVSSTSNINTGKELNITLTITKGTANGGCFFGLSEIKLTFNNKLDCEEIPSGFYRFRVSGTNKFLAAPETMPSSDAKDQFYACFIDGISYDDSHRDIWYIENLGKAEGADDGKDKFIYKVWCFQGGYGLSTNPRPSVLGSYDRMYCPRLYSIVKATEGNTYSMGGHPYDNDDVTNKENVNVFGLTASEGAIGNTGYLKHNDDYTKIHRGEGTEIKWEVWPVGPISKSVSISSIGVGTFAFNSDVKIPEGIEAYVATERGERIGLTKLEGTIPARMGVVLRKTDESKNDFQFEAVHGLGIGMSAVNTDRSLTPVEDHDNQLVGTLASTQLAVGDYILAKKKVDGVETDEVVFGEISKASNIAANKAYLPAEAVSQTRGFYTLMWGDVETGIEEIGGTAQKDGIFMEGQQIVIVKNGIKYNTKGQRVK